MVEGLLSVSDTEARIAAQEALLIAQIADGHIEEPLRKLCRRYQKSLYRFGVYLLGDEGLADELVQDTFQRLRRSAGHYDAGRDGVGPFLLVLARSAAADVRARRPSRTPQPGCDLEVPPLPLSVDQILDSLMVRAALDKLSSPHAEVLRLALDEGLTQSEVAGRLATPLHTVKARTFYAMRALCSALRSDVPIPANGEVHLARPQVADLVLGTLKPAGSEAFQHHLASCDRCQTAVIEFGHIGRTLQQLPPAVEPPPNLEARTIAHVLAAAAGDRAETQVGQLPRSAPAAAGPGVPAQPTQLPLAPPELASLYRASPGTPRQLPQLVEAGPPACAKATVIRPPRRRGRSGWYAVAGSVVAAMTAAMVISPGSPSLRDDPPVEALVAIPLHVTSGPAASGRATARHISGGWSIQLSVRGLKQLAPGGFYECWSSGPADKSERPVWINAGTFVVGRSGSVNVSMWSAAGPRQFRTVEITAESAANAGELGQVILRGVART